jgi:nitrogen fixation/metabolism regulation signal transduction histidine kinase
MAFSKSASTWYDSRLERTIAGGEKLALEYSSLLRSQLESLAAGRLPELASRYVPRDMETLYVTLSSEYSNLAAFQVFVQSPERARSYHELFFLGGKTFRLTERRAADYGDGPLPNVNSDVGNALAQLKRLKVDGRSYAFVITMRYPSGWADFSENLQISKKLAGDVSRFIPRYQQILVLLYILFACPLLILSIIMAQGLTDRIVNPLSSLEKAANRVSEGDFSVRLLTRGGDDFNSFTMAFNHMLAELERSQTISLQNEKVEAWQDIAQKLAHEMKNPLTPIKLSAERVLRRSRNEPARVGEIVEPAMLAIIQEVDSLIALLSDFKSFARLPEPQFEWANLSEIVGDLAGVYGQSHPKVRFDWASVPADLVLRADRGHLRQLFTNLFGNAIDAMGGEGQILIKADLVKRSDSRYCRIQVQDTGCGIPPELKNKLFKPYFTTKENGTGLGLSIVEHIVIDHKGEIWFESEPGVGTTFFIDLPIGDGAQAPDSGELG